MNLILSALVVSAVLLVPCAAEAPVQIMVDHAGPTGTFTFIKDLGPSTLSFDKATFVVVEEAPQIFSFDIQLKYKEPQGKGEIKVSSFVNTIAVDCNSDSILVVGARGFDADGNQVLTIMEPQVLKNPKTANAPTTEVIQHFCPTFLEIFKKRRPNGVTPDKELVTPKGGKSA